MLKELSLHILDIAENSVQAKAKKVIIKVEENLRNDRLNIQIIDNGKGMSPITLAQATNPFYTSRTTRKVGLGIPFLKEAAEACNGSLKIESKEKIGTKIEVEFQLSHIDRMPLGDLEDTFLNLVIGYTEVHWEFHFKIDNNEFVFDDEPIKKILGDLPLSDPSVLAFLRKTIFSGIAEVKSNMKNN